MGRLTRSRFLKSLLLAAPLIYCGVALGAVSVLNRFPATPLEPLLVMLTAPLLIVFWPLYPVLKPLGLLEGEWMSGPKPAGVVLGAVCYSLILWLALRIFWPEENPKSGQD